MRRPLAVGAATVTGCSPSRSGGFDGSPVIPTALRSNERGSLQIQKLESSVITPPPMRLAGCSALLMLLANAKLALCSQVWRLAEPAAFGTWRDVAGVTSPI
jgi:hypothetical protein